MIGGGDVKVRGGHYSQYQLVEIAKNTMRTTAQINNGTCYLENVFRK